MSLSSLTSMPPTPAPSISFRWDFSYNSLLSRWTTDIITDDGLDNVSSFNYSYSLKLLPISISCRSFYRHTIN